MGKIESPLGEQSFHSTETPMQHYVVSDESGTQTAPQGMPQGVSQQNVFQQHQARGEQPQQQPQQGPMHQMSQDDFLRERERMMQQLQNYDAVDHDSRQFGRRREQHVDLDAKQRIEMLLGVGRQTKDVPVKGPDGAEHTFSVRTMTGQEMQEMTQIIGLAAKAERADAGYIVREYVLSHVVFAIDGADIDMVLGTSRLSKDDRISNRAAFFNNMNEHTVNFIYFEYEKLHMENKNWFEINNEQDAKEVAEQLRKSGPGT